MLTSRARPGGPPPLRCPLIEQRTAVAWPSTPPAKYHALLLSTERSGTQYFQLPLIERLPPADPLPSPCSQGLASEATLALLPRLKLAVGQQRPKLQQGEEGQPDAVRLMMRENLPALVWPGHVRMDVVAALAKGD